MAAVSMYPDLGVNKFFDATVSIIKDNSKGFRDLVVKTPLAGLDIKKAITGSLTPTEAKLHGGLKDVKNVVGGVVDIVEATKRLKDHTIYVANGADNKGNAFGVGDYAVEVFFDAVEYVNPVNDLIAFGQSRGIIDLTAETSLALQGAGAGALVLGPGRVFVKDIVSAVKSGEEIASGDLDADEVVAEQASIVKSSLEAVKMASYVALGILLGLTVLGSIFPAMAFIAAGIPGWAMLICSTNALAFSIFGYYHKALVAPGMLS